MEGENYKIKYLKYKQKYTNALQNMQGGAVLATALTPQPKAVYVVNSTTFSNLRKLLDLKDNVNEKKITKYASCVDSLVGVSNHNVIRIIPMKKFNYKKTEIKRAAESSTSLFRGIDLDSEKIFKDGLQKIDGTPAPQKETGAIPFVGALFGDLKNTYNNEFAKQQLLNEYNYFTGECLIVSPHIVVFGADNTLHLCGPLVETSASASTTAEQKL